MCVKMKGCKVPLYLIFICVFYCRWGEEGRYYRNTIRMIDELTTQRKRVGEGKYSRLSIDDRER